MKNTFTLLALLFTITIFSQKARVERNTTSKIDYTKGTWIKPSKDNSDVTGTPYLLDNWSSTGNIIIDSKTKITVRNFNLNTRLNRFVSKKTKDSLYVFDFSQIKRVDLNNKKYKRFKNLHNDNIGYYQIIAIGKDITLLKREKKYFKEGKLNPLTQTIGRSSYVLKSRYYIESNNEITNFKIKKKTILKLFKEKSDVMKKYISKNRFSYKSDKDLALIFDYYRSL